MLFWWAIVTSVYTGDRRVCCAASRSSSSRRSAVACGSAASSRAIPRCYERGIGSATSRLIGKLGLAVRRLYPRSRSVPDARLVIAVSHQPHDSISASSRGRHGAPFLSMRSTPTIASRGQRNNGFAEFVSQTAISPFADWALLRPGTRPRVHTFSNGHRLWQQSYEGAVLSSEEWDGADPQAIRAFHALEPEEVPLAYRPESEQLHARPVEDLSEG